MTSIELAAFIVTVVVLLLCVTALASAYLFGHREEFRSTIDDTAGEA